MNARRRRSGKAGTGAEAVGGSRTQVVGTTPKPGRRAGKRWPLEAGIAVVLLASASVSLLGGGGASASGGGHATQGITPQPSSSAVNTEIAPGNEGTKEPRVRKNVKDLSEAEKATFVQAVLDLKKARSPLKNGLSYYDQFVQWHKDLYRCEVGVQHHLSGEHPMQMAHAGPMFLPWHRAFLLRFEDALQEVSGKHVSVPYWDWTDEVSTTAMFKDDLMGPDTGDPAENYVVKSGPFGKTNMDGKGRHRWQLNVHPEGAQWSHSKSDFLMRRAGSSPGITEDPWKVLPSQLKVALAAPRYDVPPYDSRSEARGGTLDRENWSFRNTLEGFAGPGAANAMQCGPDGWMTALPIQRAAWLHNYVHVWVGGILDPGPNGEEVMGTMQVPTSPNDPIFFLHHSNIDRIWWQWQQDRGIHTYEPVSGYPLNNVDSVMRPWGVTPGDVADVNHLGYGYR